MRNSSGAPVDSPSRRLPGPARVPGAALALAAALFLGFAASAAADVLVSNRSHTNGLYTPLQSYRAQAFTTGSNAAGYDLDSISIRFHTAMDSPTVEVTLWTVASDGDPGAQVGLAFTSPSSLRRAFNEFTAPANTTLAANTSYLAVLRKLTGGNTHLTTSSDGEDDGALAGWSIADGSLYCSFDPCPDFLPDSHVIAIEVRGSARRAAQPNGSLSPRASDPASPFASTATYSTIFQGEWQASDHDGELPDNAHFSRLIGGVHNADASFLAPGEAASAGVESMAETGATATLRDEVDAESNVLAVLAGTTDNIGPTETRRFNVELDTDHPRVTLLTMIAPSHDWFVGVGGLPLTDEAGRWRGSHTVDLYPWDAGTEVGDDFTLTPNVDENGVITNINGIRGFAGTAMASMSFTLQSVDVAVSVAENTAADTAIGPVLGDAVTGVGEWVLHGADEESFAVDVATGQLKTLAALDYEVRDSYAVKVSRGGTDIRVAISVTDETEPSAVIGQVVPAGGVAGDALTEENLAGATLRIDLTDETYAPSIQGSHFTLTGIAGLTVSGVTRDSATRATLTLAFDGTDFDTDATLAVTVAAAAVAGAGALSTATVAVSAVEEPSELTLSTSTTDPVLEGASFSVTMTRPNDANVGEAILVPVVFRDAETGGGASSQVCVLDTTTGRSAGSVGFAANQQSVTFGSGLEICDDTIAEARGDSVFVQFGDLNGVANYVAGSADSVEIPLERSDIRVSVKEDLAPTEMNQRFRIHPTFVLNLALTEEVLVRPTAADGTATMGACQAGSGGDRDYQLHEDLRYRIAAGETEGGGAASAIRDADGGVPSHTGEDRYVLRVCADATGEATERFTIGIDAASLAPGIAPVAPGQDGATRFVDIADEPGDRPTATLALSPAAIGEDGGTSAVTATLSNRSSAAVTLTVAAAAGTGAAAADFEVSANKVLTIAAGRTASTGTVTITARDNDVVAADKTVTVSATAAGGHGVEAPAAVELTIQEDGTPAAAAAIGEVVPAGGVAGDALTEENLAGATLRIDLTNTSYASSIAASHFTLTTAVTGLSVSGAARDGAAQATLTLAYRDDATDDFDADASLAVTVAAAALAGDAPLTTAAVDVTATVEMPPGAPAAPTVAAAGPGEFTVTWSAPDSDGGAAVTAYDVRHILTSADETDDDNWTVVEDAWASGALTHTLTGLTAGSEYDVQVRAVNAHGAGAWSATTVAAPEMQSELTLSTSTTDPVLEGASFSVTITRPNDANVGEEILVPVVFRDAETGGGPSSQVCVLDTTTGRSAGSVRLLANQQSVTFGSGLEICDDTIAEARGDSVFVQLGDLGGLANYVAGSADSVEIPLERSDIRVSVKEDLAPTEMNQRFRIHPTFVLNLALTEEVLVRPTAADDTATMGACQTGSGGDGTRDYQLHEDLRYRIAAGETEGGGAASAIRDADGGVPSQTGEDRYVLRVCADATGEATERFTIGIDAASLAPGIAPVTPGQDGATRFVDIADEPGDRPTATLALSPAAIGEDGGTSAVTAMLSNRSSAAVTLTVAAAAGTGAAAADFEVSANKVLTIAAGRTASTGTVTITARDNDVVAADKTVTVSATAAGGHGVEAPAAVELTIQEDDDTAGAPVRRTTAGAPNSTATGRPSVVGALHVGYALVASAGTIADANGLTRVDYHYQWQQSAPGARSGWEDIVGATKERFRLRAEQEGRYVRVVASFIDDDGHAELRAGRPTTVEIGPPTAAAPVVWHGIRDRTAMVGTEFRFTFARNAFYAGWELDYTAALADGSPLPEWLDFTPGRRRFSGTPPATGTVEVEVTATDFAGRTARDRFDIVVRLANSAATGEPVITGTVGVDQRLRAETDAIADANGLGAFRYQWQWRSGSGTGAGANEWLDIRWATRRTYEVGREQAGRHLRVVVRFTDGAGHAESRISEETARVVHNAPATGRPTVSGTMRVGATVRAGPGTIADDNGLEGVTYRYQWQRLNVVPPRTTPYLDIPGATSATYVVGSEIEGLTLRVVARFTDDVGFAEQRESRMTATIQPGAATAPARTVPSVSGVAVVSEPGPDGVWTEGETVEAEVRFTGAVTVDGAPTLALIAGDGIRRAGYARGSGEAALTFAWAVTAADGALAEVRVAAGGLALDGGAIRGANGADAALAFGEAPGVTAVSIGSPAGGRFDAGDAVEVTVRFAEPVTVDTADGTPTVGLVLGSAARRARYVRGSGTASLVFAYAVTAGDGAHDAAQVPADSLRADGGRIVSTGGGLAAALAHPGAAVAVLPAPVPVSVSVADARGTEGGSAAFTVTLSEAAAGPVTVDYATADGTAVAGADYTAQSGTLTFAAGQTRMTVEVALLDDGTAEGEETFALSLSNAQGAALGDAEAAGTIEAQAPDSAGETLTARFAALPDEHDGETPFVFELRFSEAPAVNFGTIRFHAFRVSGGEVSKVRRAERGSNLAWTVTVAPGGPGDVAIALPATPDCAAAHAICTASGAALASAAATVRGPALLTVADAEAREGADAAAEFVVTLSRAAFGVVTVDYATADGTAVAGADYTAQSGSLTFAAGERDKTVAVPVLDDGHDEGEETFAFTLSNAAGARIADGEATGTIVNADAMPRAWLARFGRTAAEQVLEGVQARLVAPRAAGSHAQVAGQPLVGAGQAALVRLEAEMLARRLAGTEAAGGRAPSGPGVLAGSAFAVTAAAGPDAAAQGGSSSALWGRGGWSRFDGDDDGLSVDGEMLSATLGADYAIGRWLAGAMLSHARGSGSYDGEAGGGAVESTLTGIFPFAGVDLGKRLTAWAAAGVGVGGLTLTPAGARALETDLTLLLAALGARGRLVEPTGGSGFSLAIETDAFWARTSSGTVPGMAGAEADATRLRLGLGGGHRFALAAGGMLEPTFEIGVRHDGGHAETGYGMDVGGRLAWTDRTLGLSAQVSGRGLLIFETGGFRDVGLSGSLTWDPDPSTASGPSLTVRQTLGSRDAGGMRALLGRPTLAGLAATDDGLDSRRLDLRAGYGFGADGSRFIATPEAGVALEPDGREYRVGWRFALAEAGPTAFEIALEGTRREHATGAAPPQHALGVKVKVR